MKNIFTSVDNATQSIQDNSTVMIGGFGGAGSPVELIHALIDRFRQTGSPHSLTLINNNAGDGLIGIGAMINAGMVKKMICSFPRSSNPTAFNERFESGELGLELVPQGTLAERIRAGGAGIPAFYTPASFGTQLSDGKPTKEFEGKMYVEERWLKADYALIKAETGDTHGNLTYCKSSRNFSPLMAMAAKQAIVQIGRLIPVEETDPETVVTPGIFVQGLVEVSSPQQERVLAQAGATY